MIAWIDILFYRILASLSMLVYGSYRDIKIREIEDKLWIFFGSIGVALNILEIFWGSLDSIIVLVSIGVTSAIAFTLYYFGFYGGADAKALVVVAILLPVYTPLNRLHPLTGLMVLSNGVILTLCLPIYFTIKNITKIVSGEKIFRGFEDEPRWRKVIACLLGYRSGSSERPFLLSLEKSVDGRRRFSFGLLGIEDEFETRKDVWVTPGIPLVVFLTLGFVVTVLYGDLLVLMLNGFRYLFLPQ